MHNHKHTPGHRTRARGAAIAKLLFLTLVAIAGSLVAFSTSADAIKNPLVSDDFNGPAGAPPNTKVWVPMIGGGGWGNNELETYTGRPSNISLDGKGHLAITARKETYSGTDGITRNYTSARVVNITPFMYGYLAARIYLPKGQGLWPAFWTVGADIVNVGWPASGEIDVMEAKNQMTNVLGSIHGPTQSATPYGVSHAQAPAGGISGWHVFALIWHPGKLTWLVDGKAYSTMTKTSLRPGQSWVFDKPQAIELNLAVGGDWPGSPDSTTPAVATMLVDWVRQYSF